jgi:hypothetical protein
MCIKSFPLAVERLADEGEPESWREFFFVSGTLFYMQNSLTGVQALRQFEAKRLEEIGARVRSTRFFADEQREERQVKPRPLDRKYLLPPSRSWRHRCK